MVLDRNTLNKFGYGGQERVSNLSRFCIMIFQRTTTVTKKYGFLSRNLRRVFVCSLVLFKFFSYPFEVGRVETEQDIHSEDGVHDAFEPPQNPLRVLLEGNSPWDERHAVHDHTAHEQIPA